MAKIDNASFLILVLGTIVFGLSLYGISKNKEDKCSGAYITSVASASVSTGAIIASLLYLIVRTNSICEVFESLPKSATFSRFN